MHVSFLDPSFGTEQRLKPLNAIRHPSSTKSEVSNWTVFSLISATKFLKGPAKACSGAKWSKEGERSALYRSETLTFTLTD